MVKETLLLSLLRFVALSLPAVAILMQVYHDKGTNSDSSYEFEFLQISFTMMVIGGIVIGSQFVKSINNDLTRTGAILIFISLPTLAIAIWWEHLPESLKPKVSAPGTLVDYFKTTVLAGVLMILAPAISNYYYYKQTIKYVDIFDGLGPLSSAIGSEELLIVLLIIFISKSVFWTYREKEFPPENFAEFFGYSLASAIFFAPMYFVMTAPPYFLFLGLYEVFSNTLPQSGLLYLIPDIWAAIVTLAFVVMTPE